MRQVPGVTKIGSVQPWIQESKSWKSGSVLIIRLGAWFPWSIDCDFDGFRVRCHLERHRADLYCEGKRFSSSTAPDKSKIVKFGNLIFHDCRAISEFAAAIFIISSTNSDDGTVGDLIKCNDLEGHWQRLIGPPMGGQNAAENCGTSGLH